MNLFNNLFSQLKETIKKSQKENAIKAGHKKQIADLESQKIELENKISNHIVDDEISFTKLSEIWEQYALVNENINMLNGLYSYLFEEEVIA